MRGLIYSKKERPWKLKVSFKYFLPEQCWVKKQRTGNKSAPTVETFKWPWLYKYSLLLFFFFINYCDSLICNILSSITKDLAKRLISISLPEDFCTWRKSTTMIVDIVSIHLSALFVIIWLTRLYLLRALHRNPALINSSQWKCNI